VQVFASVYSFDRSLLNDDVRLSIDHFQCNVSSGLHRAQAKAFLYACQGFPSYNLAIMAV